MVPGAPRDWEADEYHSVWPFLDMTWRPLQLAVESSSSSNSDFVTLVSAQTSCLYASRCLAETSSEALRAACL